MKNIGASEALIFTKGLKMLKQRKAAAEQLAARLFETEFAMDEAIIKRSEERRVGREVEERRAA